MKSENSPLFPLIHDYLKIYLPKQRKVSPNTIRSYRKSLDGLLDYVKECSQIPLCSVTFEHLTAEMILSFLEYLETECGCSALTCNTRFAAIRAFMDYAADRDVTLVATLGKLRKIPFKKSISASIINYMSMEVITAIVAQPDANTSKGLRDRFFIMLMYDTGARVQEMLDIKLCDLQLGRSSKITLCGKGSKTRVVPLMQKTVQHLQKYLSEFHAGTTMTPNTPLFYSVTHGVRNPLTDRLIRYMLQKYGEKARSVCPEVPENVHPHLFRHAFGTHLYENGTDLFTLKALLGHKSLNSTTIYVQLASNGIGRAISPFDCLEDTSHA